MKDDPSGHLLSQRIRALAHPARLAIVRALAESGGCTCGVIVESLPLAQSTVSQHLKVLREAGLVAGQADGARTCYRLERDVMAALRHDLAGLMDALAPREGANPCST